MFNGNGRILPVGDINHHSAGHGAAIASADFIKIHQCEHCHGDVSETENAHDEGLGTIFLESNGVIS